MSLILLFRLGDVSLWPGFLNMVQKFHKCNMIQFANKSKFFIQKGKKYYSRISVAKTHPVICQRSFISKNVGNRRN